MGTREDLMFLPIVDEELSNLEPENSETLETGLHDKMATTILSVSPKSSTRSSPSVLHCDISADSRSKIASDFDAAGEISKSHGVRLHIQSMEKYALEKVPSPVRIKPQEKASGCSSPDLSPPPSPKRKREADINKDTRDVPLTGFSSSKHADLYRSQSTF